MKKGEYYLKFKICVLGLGYIGLPTASMFASHGHKVIGVDINKDVVTALNSGQVTIEEPFLDIMVQAAVTSENLVAKTKPEEADVFIISVPTPIKEDKTADMDYVKQATESILPYIKEGNIVILESTSPVGTTNDFIIPILEKSGLDIGKDLYIGYSPERVLPGQILMELVNNNRIIGGINKKSAQKIRDVYKTFVKGKMYLTTTKVAEMCKLMENTYRDANIALSNELAQICDGFNINAWEVIELCNYHPRVNLHQPGPGVGGHCLAVDPWFIVEKSPAKSQIIKLSREINDSMPEYVVGKIENILKDIKYPKKVTILGITYKPNIDDLRESPVLKIINLLEEKNYNISVFDPYVRDNKYLCNDILNASEDSDLLILAVNHNEFNGLPYEDIQIQMRNKNVLDTRNFLDEKFLKQLGYNYYLLGNNLL